MVGARIEEIIGRCGMAFQNQQYVIGRSAVRNKNNEGATRDAKELYRSKFALQQ